MLLRPRDREEVVRLGVPDLTSGPLSDDLLKAIARQHLTYRLLERHTGAEERHMKALERQEGGSHYEMPIQPIEFIVANEIPYREANVIKYTVRHGSKNGAEDIKKAIHYLEMILEDYDEEDTNEGETEERHYEPYRSYRYEVGSPQRDLLTGHDYRTGGTSVKEVANIVLDI